MTSRRLRWAAFWLAASVFAHALAAATAVAGEGEPMGPAGASGGGLLAAVAKAFPEFARCSPLSRKLVLDAVAAENSSINPAGSYRTPRGPVTGEDLDFQAVPVNAADQRVWLYRVQPGEALKIPDADRLRAAANPPDLNLADSWLEDLSLLQGLTFTNLDITRCPVRDLSPLTDHQSLTRLKAERIPATDVSPLARLPLTDLSLADTPVADLAPLRACPLRELDVSGCPVADLTPIARCPLVRLVVARTAVTDLAPLAKARDASSLATLDLGHTRVTDLAPLRRLSVTRLLLRGGMVTDLAPLRDQAFEELDLSYSAFRDAALLPTLKVRNLNLAGLPFSDLSLLRGLKVEKLSLFDVPARKLAPLKDVSVEHLWLSRWVRYDDVESLKEIPGLKTLQSLPTEHMAVAAWFKRHYANRPAK